VRTLISLALLGVLSLAACGDNLPAEPDAAVSADAAPDTAPGDILERLKALPGVTAMEWMPPEGFPVEPGYRYFDLWFTQPVDHGNAAAGTFQQYVALMHVDTTAPLVIYTSGYDAGWTVFLTEPAELVQGNQISIEYRFYADSRPAVVDWTKLTVAQAQADEHAIITALATLYSGKRIATGGSKGGENAMEHMSRYPQDLDGVVAYVAPVITDNPDLRYATVLDDIGIDTCTTALRAIQREMLLRRTAMETRAAANDAYTIAGVAHATETAIVELEFSFWMTRGEPDCGDVPATTATDTQLYDFLDDTGGPSGYADDALRVWGSLYIYQDQLELGYPVWQHAHLDDLMQFSYEDWSVYMPAPVSGYDPSAARALAAYLAGSPKHVMHIGGEWDPWGAGYPTIAAANESVDLRVMHGSHWSSGIYSLPSEQRIAATAQLRAWAGVTAAAPAPRLPRGSMATRGLRRPTARSAARD
jgi:hypothetical protein